MLSTQQNGIETIIGLFNDNVPLPFQNLPQIQARYRLIVNKNDRCSSIIHYVSPFNLKSFIHRPSTPLAAMDEHTVSKKKMPP
ncbi:MAG: hypothetical protein RSB35_03900 [Eubacterium sp.]